MAKKPPNNEDEIVIGGGAGRPPMDAPMPNQYQEDEDEDEDEVHKLGGVDFHVPGFPTDDVEVENPISAVASAPAKNILILGILAVVAIFFLYKYLFSESPEVIAEKKLQQQAAEQPVESAKEPTKQEEKPQVNIGVVETPELPAMENQPLPMPSVENTIGSFQPPDPVLEKEAEMHVPAPDMPAAPEVPTAVPTQVKIEAPAAEVLAQVPVKVVEPVVEAPPPTEAEIAAAEAAEAAAKHARILEKRKSGMLVMNGGGTPKDVASGKLDPDAVGKSGAASVKATKVDNLSLMILQGKMIEAVLETTINTDLPGSLRAVISRDIYAESGKNILIPKASRLIGSYGSGITPGQTRLIVSWGRVIRPDGVDIDIASAGTDQLGRAGMTGIVDNKYFELFSNSILVSALTIGGSIAVNKIQKAQTTTSSTTSNTDGSSTSSQTGSATDATVLQAAQGMSDTLSKVMQGYSTNPTIIINQGARIKVFVNKDLVFPASVVNRVSSGN